jgi:hypothetical protein
VTLFVFVGRFFGRIQPCLTSGAIGRVHQELGRLAGPLPFFIPQLLPDAGPRFRVAGALLIVFGGLVQNIPIRSVLAKPALKRLGRTMEFGRDDLPRLAGSAEFGGDGEHLLDCGADDMHGDESEGE